MYILKFNLRKKIIIRKHDIKHILQAMLGTIFCAINFGHIAW